MRVVYNFCTANRSAAVWELIHSRWYPETIAKRISAIVSVASKIEFYHADAFEILEEHKTSQSTVFFIDPPYTVGGKRAGSRLYNH